MYFLLALSIAFASMNSILLHKVRLSSSAAVFRLNLISALVWLVSLFTLNGFRFTPSRTVLIFGLLYGITQALFILFKSLAMNRGPVSITALLGNGSLLISVAFCYFAFGEAVTLWDAVGLFALLLAICLTNYKRGANEAPPSRGWLVFALLFMALGAGVGIAFKTFAKNGGGADAGDMMCVAAAVMALLFLPFYLVSKKREDAPERIDRRFLLLALGSGLLSCLYNRLNITLSGALDAIIFFPFFNGGVVILTAVCSVMFTKGRLSARKAVGLLLGTAAIAVIGIF